MFSTRQTLQILCILGVCLIGSWGCGQKHLNVSTSSGKANEQGELEAELADAPAEQAGLQDMSLSESGLAGQAKSEEAASQDTAMADVGPPPQPSSASSDTPDEGKGTEEPLEISEAGTPMESPVAPSEDASAKDALAMAPTDAQEAGEEQAPAEGRERELNQLDSPTAMEPVDNQEDAVAGLSNSPEEAPLVALSTPEDQALESIGPSLEEEFDALSLDTQAQEAPMDSPHVEHVPENIVVAKAEPSSAVEEQLARIKEEELATVAAGLKDVFFEFDSWRITEDGKDVLEKSADWLQEKSNQKLLIEGHCDQRGTRAYNIVLGKKRAIAIRDYLVQLGIEPSRLSVITYGKERPFCTSAQTEDCYKENRRGHLIVQKP